MRLGCFADERRWLERRFWLGFAAVVESIARRSGVVMRIRFIAANTGAESPEREGERTIERVFRRQFKLAREQHWFGQKYIGLPTSRLLFPA